MPKINKKTKKNSKKDKKDLKNCSVGDEEVKKEEEEEETEKEVGALSDGVLDAFEEVAPVDPLLEDEALLIEEDEEDIDSGDYRPSDEW